MEVLWVSIREGNKRLFWGTVIVVSLIAIFVSSVPIFNDFGNLLTQRYLVILLKIIQGQHYRMLYPRNQ